MKTYTLQVSHVMLHAIAEAIDVAQFIAKNVPPLAIRFATVTSGPERQIELAKLLRAVMAAHRDAVEDDGHGDQFLSQPLQGEELADAMSNHDERVREMDIEILAAEVALETGGESLSEGQY